MSCRELSFNQSQNPSVEASRDRLGAPPESIRSLKFQRTLKTRPQSWRVERAFTNGF